MHTEIHPLSAAEPDPDTLHALFGDEHRRSVLVVLRERGSAVPLDDLADQVAARVRDVDTDAVSDEARKRVRVQLHHRHLPKLEHARLLDYDTRTKTVIPLQVEAIAERLNSFDDEIAAEFH